MFFNFSPGMGVLIDGQAALAPLPITERNLVQVLADQRSQIQVPLQINIGNVAVETVLTFLGFQCCRIIVAYPRGEVYGFSVLRRPTVSSGVLLLYVTFHRDFIDGNS